jgi:hypothetical protein
MPPGPPAPGWLMSGLFEAIVAWRWTRRIAELDRRLRDAEHWLMMLQGLGSARLVGDGEQAAQEMAIEPPAAPRQFRLQNRLRQRALRLIRSHHQKRQRPHLPGFRETRPFQYPHGESNKTGFGRENQRV